MKRWKRSFQWISVLLTVSLLAELLPVRPVDVAEAASVAQMVWADKSPAGSVPSGRTAPVMAYDGTRQQLVLFGGYTGGSPIRTNDTWVWDGKSWTQKHPLHSPPSRSGAGIAYDPVAQKVVLFGGDGLSSELNDTWLWDGSDWTQVSPAHMPTTRGVVQMAWDGDEIVLFGGSPGYNGSLGDTWTWNGSDWTQQSPAASPPGRQFGSMSFDGKGSLMFGGQQVLSNGSYTYLNDTWRWDGTTHTWAKLITTSSPAIRATSGMGYDGQRVILYGGQNQSVSQYSDTWIFDPASDQWSPWSSSSRHE